MTYMHYADREVVLDRTRSYVQTAPSAYLKPQGFWISVVGDDDWETWCRSEEFALGSLEHRHEVTLTLASNILYIPTSAALGAFHRVYTVETEYERRYNIAPDRWPVDWQRVAGEYDGIIIAPYQWPQRYDLSWYYGWDCASGCVWNLTAIESLTPVMTAVESP